MRANYAFAPPLELVRWYREAVSVGTLRGELIIGCVLLAAVPGCRGRAAERADTAWLSQFDRVVGTWSCVETVIGFRATLGFTWNAERTALAITFDEHTTGATSLWKGTANWRRKGDKVIADGHDNRGTSWTAVSDGWRDNVIRWRTVVMVDKTQFEMDEMFQILSMDSLEYRVDRPPGSKGPVPDDWRPYTEICTRQTGGLAR